MKKSPDAPPGGKPAGKGEAPEAPQPLSLTENLQMVWRLRSHFLPFILPAVGLLLLALVQADLALTATTAAQQVIDRITVPEAAAGAAGEAPRASITFSEYLFRSLTAGASPLTLALLLALFLLLAQGLGIGIEQVRTRVSQSFRQRLQSNLVRAMARELAVTRGRRSSGNTSQIFMADASGLSGLLIFGLVRALENLVKMGVYAYGLWRIPDGWLILLIAFPAVLIFQAGVAGFFLNREARVNEGSQMLLVQLRSRTTELLDNLSRLVYFRGDRAEVDRLLDLSWRAGEANRRFQLVSSIHSTFAGLVITLSLPLVVIVLRNVGNISPGTIVQAQSLVMLLAGTIAALVDIPSMLAQFSPSLRRIEEILNIPEPEPEPPQLAQIRATSAPPSIIVEDLSFTYPGAAAPLLKEVYLEIPAGACVGVVGPSGCGKSTLARLLLGDQRPTSGRILFGGIDITSWHLWWRREFIGFLPAEQGFLRGTLEENVLFGRSREEVRDYERALEASGVAAIAREKAADGGMQILIDSRVEDVLSTGQRRKIGIARLLVGDHRLWIFDEPGSGLDPRSMNEVASALAAAVQGRTSIIITHDPDVFITDFVIFMLHGTIADIGSHAELFERNPAYRGLVTRNAQERAEEGLRPAAPPMGPPRPAGMEKMKIPISAVEAD